MAKRPQDDKRPIHKTFLFNLCVIISICLILYWIFFASLSRFTHHGQSIAVPNLVGMTLPEAERLISGGNFNVDIDSTYEPGKKALVILSQQPDADFHVKKGHTLFLTVNKVISPTTPMPSLINLSYRSAKMLLKSSKLILGDTIMKPDLAQGAVLEQLFNGKPIEAGTPIAQGSAITLVVGNGFGQTKMDVPNIIGMSYPEAVALLSGSNLNYNVAFDGTITDTVTAVVYQQSPEAFNPADSTPNKIEEGMVVDFRVQQNYAP